MHLYRPPRNNCLNCIDSCFPKISTGKMFGYAFSKSPVKIAPTGEVYGCVHGPNGPEFVLQSHLSGCQLPKAVGRCSSNMSPWGCREETLLSPQTTTSSASSSIDFNAEAAAQENTAFDALGSTKRKLDAADGRQLKQVCFGGPWRSASAAQVGQL